MVRLLDFVGSLLLFIALLPLFAVLSLLIFLQDFHNPIFTQQRVGKNLKLFKILKFRTMKVEQGEMANKMTQKNDTRITFLGKILRKTSLDELPQIINVLTGDMSFVGPRPYMAWQVEQFNNEEEWAKRHTVRPGITGLAQINGRSALDQNARTKLDFEYIDNYSLKMYLKVFIDTLFKVVKLIKSAN
tara:strand:+ start:6896 stop:7459 length:564 start_codon:yes stop_codon:yes gene_type:complete